MNLRILFVVTLAFSALAARAAEPVVPEDVMFEKGIEFANPDGQHLQLDLAMPKTGDGPFPRHRQHSRRWFSRRHARGI